MGCVNSLDIVSVLDVDTRALVTSDGATKAEAQEAQAMTITADFILVAFKVSGTKPEMCSILLYGTSGSLFWPGSYKLPTG